MVTQGHDTGRAGQGRAGQGRVRVGLSNRALHGNKAASCLHDSGQTLRVSKSRTSKTGSTTFGMEQY